MYDAKIWNVKICFWHEFAKEILDENDLKQLQYAQWQKKSKWSPRTLVKFSCTMADIIDLNTSKLEFFYITILSRMLSQNLFKIRKTIWLKMKSSIILNSVKIINIFHKMKYKVVIGIINVVRSLLLYFITKMQMIVFNMNHLFLYLIIWIMINFGLPGTNFWNIQESKIQEFKNYHNQKYIRQKWRCWPTL